VRVCVVWVVLCVCARARVCVRERESMKAKVTMAVRL